MVYKEKLRIILSTKNSVFCRFIFIQNLPINYIYWNYSFDSFLFSKNQHVLHINAVHQIQIKKYFWNLWALCVNNVNNFERPALKSTWSNFKVWNIHTNPFLCFLKDGWPTHRWPLHLNFIVINFEYIFV